MEKKRQQTENDEKTASDSGSGPERNIILRKAENREEWKKLVVGSPAVVPQRSDYGIGEDEGDNQYGYVKEWRKMGSLTCNTV